MHSVELSILYRRLKARTEGRSWTELEWNERTEGRFQFSSVQFSFMLQLWLPTCLVCRRRSNGNHSVALMWLYSVECWTVCHSSYIEDHLVAAGHRCGSVVLPIIQIWDLKVVAVAVPIKS